MSSTRFNVSLVAERDVQLRSINNDGTVTLRYEGSDYKLLPKDSLTIQIDIHRSLNGT